MDYLLPILALLVFLLAIALVLLLIKLKQLKGALAELEFQKSSQAVRYGKMTEHFIPFAEQFPFSPERFRFLGEPIDGIVFEDDRIIFAEFKAASSQLSPRQKQIKELVKSRAVEWFEFRMK